MTSLNQPIIQINLLQEIDILNNKENIDLRDQVIIGLFKVVIAQQDLEDPKQIKDSNRDQQIFHKMDLLITIIKHHIKNTNRTIICAIIKISNNIRIIGIIKIKEDIKTNIIIENLIMNKAITTKIDIKINSNLIKEVIMTLVQVIEEDIIQIHQ